MEIERRIHIKTKVDHPFIYFLLDQNTVLTYQFEIGKYVTGTDLIESGDMVVYELDSAAAFESFNHRERNPVEGSSIFMNQQDIGCIVDEINKEVQKRDG